MKIGIVTWFHYKNYGTVLQAYALQSFLKSQGYKCELINYIPLNNKTLIQKIKLGNFKKRILNKIESYRFKFLSEVEKEELKKRNNKFEKFLNKNIDFTSKIYSYDDLLKLNDMFDCFICGSDQIWNPNNLNGFYFLDFVNDKRKKISYAPSFGVKYIQPSKEIKIQQWINKFDKISVREEDGANILNNLTQKDVQVVVDPTLLLSSKIWKEISINPGITDDYILCYFLGDKKEYWEILDKLNKITNYKIVVIPIKFNSYLKKYEIRISTGPEEFLGLIKNARLILTDSFHGTIFSLLFEKDFYVFKRFSDSDKKSQNSRIYNILKMVNLEDRIIDKNIILNNSSISIVKYKQIKEILDEKIKKSKSFLLNALKE